MWACLCKWTHMIAFVARLLLCASVWQEQRSSFEEPPRSPNSAPHLCHICLPVPSRCVNLPPWHLFTCGTALHLAGERASTFPHPSHLLLLKASVTHLSFLSSTPASRTGPAKAGREPSKWKWWPLCPSSRFSRCGRMTHRGGVDWQERRTKAGFFAEAPKFY